MAFKLLIVEDEPIIAFDLKQCVEQEGFEVIGIAASAEEAFLKLEANSPDLVLLDIKIKGEADGISVAKHLNETNIPFVFITSSHDVHTLERVKLVKPAGFILKPFRDEEVLANIHLAIKKQTPAEDTRVKAERIFIRDGGALRPIQTKDLLFVKGESNYSVLYFRDGRSYTLAHTLKSIQEKLPEATFCRVHKSYLINLEYIDLIEHSILKIGEHIIPIGKSHRGLLFDKLQVL